MIIRNGERFPNAGLPSDFVWIPWTVYVDAADSPFEHVNLKDGEEYNASLLSVRRVNWTYQDGNIYCRDGSPLCDINQFPRFFARNQGDFPFLAKQESWLERHETEVAANGIFRRFLRPKNSKQSSLEFSLTQVSNGVWREIDENEYNVLSANVPLSYKRPTK